MMIDECHDKYSVSEALCDNDAKVFKATPQNEKLMLVRKTHPELEGLNDEQAFDVIYRKYYSHLSRGLVAEKIGLVIPEHRSSCRKFFPQFYE
ncbi:MAG: hypothetical protein VB032_08755 [Burkholderiaceae bacterium]|nr:hypothetical protein [Burkholderiaceae bacterium]